MGGGRTHRKALPTFPPDSRPQPLDLWRFFGPGEEQISRSLFAVLGQVGTMLALSVKNSRRSILLLFQSM